jgi:hypothetical protein
VPTRCPKLGSKERPGIGISPTPGLSYCGALQVHVKRLDQIWPLSRGRWKTLPPMSSLSQETQETDMKHGKWFWFVGTLVASCLAVVIGYSYFAVASQTDKIIPAGKGKEIEPLPLRQVVLFNSGVGYFQREGEVDGNARIELSFPIGDINDLLMSLVLQDAKGRVGTVNYDSSDPIDKILRSFALDLTNNPTFAQILNQARGEKIEITRSSEKKDGPVSKIIGTIIGMEIHQRPVGKDHVIEMEILNLNTSTGLQAIPMEHIVSVRFLNAVLESEFQRALHVLARSHDTEKKSVSIGFSGEGKRAVRVGYVLDRPIWRTTYRLSMDPKGKVFLQGWALVENTSDDDWNDVRMVLVSGKPISFKMNLYEPIYIPRPGVELEMFASLRPPLYNSALDAAAKKTPALAAAEFERAAQPSARNSNLIQKRQDLRSLDRDGQERFAGEPNKLSYAELQRRRQEQLGKAAEAKEKGSAVAGLNFREGVQSVANAGELGDYYRYAIDQKITLPRQKSAMLPILNQAIEGEKFSIYNESVQARYPLLGLKLKNTSGQSLTQGPITVYDNDVFAGDTRILDLQPNEERLLSYALDQGTEVKTDVKQTLSPELTFRIGTDTLNARYHLCQTKTYTIKNRSTHDRQMILEHPIRSDWKLIEPKKANEQTRDLYRFDVAVPAGKTVAYEVVEEEPRVDNIAIHGGQPTYAVANGINIKVTAHTAPAQLVGLKIVKGFILPTEKVRDTHAYFVQNLSDMDRTFTIDYIVRPGWTLLPEKGEPEKGPEVLRFKLSIEKGKTGEKAVREERTVTEKGILLKQLPEATIRGYLAGPVPSAEVKAALTKALSIQAKITEAQKKIADLEKQFKMLTEDQTRARENLKIIPMSSDYYKTFLEKFVDQEKQFESLQTSIRQENATLESQQRDYDQYLAKLDAE